MPKQRAVEQLRQEVIRLREEGLSFSAIARRLAVCKSYVVKLAHSEPSVLQPSEATTALTVRQRRFAAGLVEGKSQRQAALDAGVSPGGADAFAHRTLRNKRFRETFEQMLERHGLSEEQIAQVHAENLRATRVVTVKDGQPVFHPDYATRQRAVDSAWGLHGRKGPGSESREGDDTPLVLNCSIEMAISFGELIGAAQEAIDKVRKLGEAGVTHINTDELKVIGYWPDMDPRRQRDSRPAIDINPEGQVDSVVPDIQAQPCKP